MMLASMIRSELGAIASEKSPDGKTTLIKAHMKANYVQVASTFLLVAAALSACHGPLLPKNSLPSVTEAGTVLQNFKGEYSYGGGDWALNPTTGR